MKKLMETKRKCIERGMLIYETPPQVIPSRIDKENCYVLSKEEMQKLKEDIEQDLQRKDEEHRKQTRKGNSADGASFGIKEK